jgi:hypothetical protein
MSSYPLASSLEGLSPRDARGVHIGLSIPMYGDRDSAIQFRLQRHVLTLVTKEAGLELEDLDPRRRAL